MSWKKGGRRGEHGQSQLKLEGSWMMISADMWKTEMNLLRGIENKNRGERIGCNCFIDLILYCITLLASCYDLIMQYWVYKQNKSDSFSNAI